MPVAITLDGTEQVPLVQPPGIGGTQKRTTVFQIASLASLSYLFLNAQSVFGNPTNSTSVGTSLAGTYGQVLTYNSSGVLQWSSVDLANTTTVTGILTVTHGGIGTSALNSHEVLVGNGTGEIQSVTNSTAGYALISNGATSTPSFQLLSITASITGVLDVPHGGIGTSTIASGSLVLGRGTASVSAVANATSGYFLLASGSTTAPAFGLLDLSATSVMTSILPVLRGGVGTSALTANALLAGNGTSTVVLIAPAVTGRLLASQGTGSVPAFLSSAYLATALLTPLVVGSTAAAGFLTLQSTDTTGASDYVVIAGGTNGATVFGLFNAAGLAISTVTGTPRFDIDVNRNTTSVASVGGDGGTLQRWVNADSTNSILEIRAANAIPQILAVRAPGTLAAPTANVTSNVSLNISGYGYDGAALQLASTLQVLTTEAWTTAATGMSIALRTTAAQTTTTRESARFGAGLSIGTTLDPGRGNINASGSIQILLSTTPPTGGTVGQGYTFFSPSPALGLYAGTGSPTMTAALNSIYLRSDGVTSATRAYVNISGTGSWTYIVCAS